MYPHQAERLGEALEQAAVDALVATAPENVLYTTGFASPAQAARRGAEVYAVFTRESTALVIPAADAASAAIQSLEVPHVRTYGRFTYAKRGGDEVARRIAEWSLASARDASDALAAALAALGLGRGRVGVDEGGLTAPQWTRTAARLSSFAVVEAARAFGRARQVKGPWEIECLHRALAISEEAVNVVVQRLSVGATEREAALLYRREVEQRGARPSAVVVLFGERTAYPAVEPSDRSLKPGDLVRFDVGCVFKGYCADLGRTAVMGEPNSAQTDVHDAIRLGLEAALDLLKPGVTAAEVFTAAANAVRAGGIGEYDPAHVGHGIGLAPCEPPLLAPDNAAALEPGMVLRLEMSYDEPGWGGVCLKDTVLLTRRDAAAMNRSTRGLVVLD